MKEFTSYLKCIREMTEPTEIEFFSEVADYVGANETIDMKRFGKFLKPYIKNFNRTWRWWPNTNYDPSKPFRPKLTNNTTLATTKDLDVIEEMINGYDPDSQKYIVTEHSGKGVYLNAILKDALKTDLGKNDDYIRSMYRSYHDQEEVLMIPPYKKPKVIGYWDPQEQELEII